MIVAHGRSAAPDAARTKSSVMTPTNYRLIVVENSVVIAILLCGVFSRGAWWARQDSNLQPDRYEREDIG
jgi:hypothetical protein